VSRVYLTEKGIKIRGPIEQIWKKQQEKLLKGLSADGVICLINVKTNNLAIYLVA
jgi:DNA-binding MarR family transcriptional regulator